MSDDERGGVSKSRSRSPVASPARSLSRSRSLRRSVSRSPRRSISPVPRSISPRRSRSRSRGRGAAGGDWRRKLERLFESGEVRKSELDDFTLDGLEELTDDQAECAVERFTEANFGKITNKNGFLMGIIRRVKQDGPDKDGADVDSLPRSVRHKLLDLIEDKRLTRSDLDARMCKALSDLPSDLGLEAVNKFSMSNLDTVKSKTGFMMGIIKRLQTESVAPPARYGGGGYRDRNDRPHDRYDRGGYDRGYDRYDRGGYDRGGYDRYDRGYDRGGYDRGGYDRGGYDRGGYDRGYGRDRFRY